MKVGILTGFNSATPAEFIAGAARAAEERGFHSFWLPEHVVFFPEYESRYPYAKDGKVPGNPDGVLEPLTALGFLAAHTRRIRLGTGICLVAQRNPVYTAKQVADVDFLSGGRLDFGVGIGWLREEFEALHVPFENRAARTRDYLGVMKSLWCDEVSSYKGEYYTLPDCLANPKPIQKPHPPIFFGGESRPALRRVAEIGQGWFGFDLPPEDVPRHLAALDAQLAEADRSRGDVQIFISPYLRSIDKEGIQRYRDLGVDQIILPAFGRSVEDFGAALDRHAALTGV